MKQIYTAFLLLAVVALYSCRKEGNDIDIKTYDKQQIEAYIKTNNLTNMKNDASSGDTTGIYYEILAQGKGDVITDPTRAAFIYTIRSLDGNYAVTDTITSRSYSYVGSLAPKGLILAFKNIIKTKGTRARIIIPSRLAYGTSGSGTGSGRLPGNTSLEYYINVMDDYVDPTTKLLTRQNAYDEISIRKYAAANGIDLSTYNHTTSGLFWKQTQADTGKVVVTDKSTVYVQYTGILMNGTLFDTGTNANPAGEPLEMESITPGFAEGIKKIKAGGKVSMLIPSNLAYGYSGITNDSGVIVIPPFSCLRFDVNLMSVVSN